jgi:hypothetical protein
MSGQVRTWAEDGVVRDADACEVFWGETRENFPS